MNEPKTITLLDTLMKCIDAAEKCASGCLKEKSTAELEACIRRDIDCADVCSLTMRFVARSSPNLDGALQLCIDSCRACEEECRKHEHDHCRQCADLCLACYEACIAYRLK